jgi:CRISPR system Cascade subunit CasD
MDTRFILLWLEGPLQAWGSDSKFGRRESLKFPTKSGVLGLVCCALGATGEQRELLEEFSSLSQTVVSYTKALREPLLRDFQMVGSGYDESDPWQTLLIPKKNDGGKAVGGGTKMTYRFYLQDARFAVVLEVPSSRAGDLADALQNPVYDLYLGRKTCAPTDFIYRGTFDTEEDALTQALSIANEKGVTQDFQVVDGEATGEVMTLNDVPIQFGENKKYRDRRVTVVS